MYLLLIMIKTLHFLGTIASINCLGTLASQHLTNTLFNMGLKTHGAINSENFMLAKAIGWSKSPALGCARISPSVVAYASTCA
jgi:hypothetical protein